MWTCLHALVLISRHLWALILRHVTTSSGSFFIKRNVKRNLLFQYYNKLLRNEDTPVHPVQLKTSFSFLRDNLIMYKFTNNSHNNN